MTPEESSRVLSLEQTPPAAAGARAAAAGALSRAGRRLVFSLSPAGMLGGLLLLALGFVGVFCLGVVIGRGHEPEAGIPELARMMPEPAQRNAPRVIDADGAQSPGALNASLGERPGIIDQGDLEYRLHLKSQSQAPAQSQARSQAQSPSSTQPGGQEAGGQTRQSQKPDAARQPQAEARGPQTPEAAPPFAPAPGTAGEERPKSPDQRIYHYSYQAASFKDQPSCDSFADRLTRAGFATRTEKVQADGKTWFRVMVDFTGRPDDTDALRDKLKAHGVPKALLRGKTPAH